MGRTNSVKPPAIVQRIKKTTNWPVFNSLFFPFVVVWRVHTGFTEFVHSTRNAVVDGLSTNPPLVLYGYLAGFIFKSIFERY